MKSERADGGAQTETPALLWLKDAPKDVKQQKVANREERRREVKVSTAGGAMATDAPLTGTSLGRPVTTQLCTLITMIRAFNLVLYACFF